MTSLGDPAAPPPGWSAPRPATIPPPTYWPAVLAAGVAGACLGVLTSVVVAAVGLLVCAVALGGWIGDLARDQARSHGER
ncbi:MAG TPA: hypothetical protein VGQ83_30605 [Polyangia bacterium]